MKSDLFQIGKITIHGYGTMIFIGIIVAYIVAEYRAKKRNENPDTAFDLAVWAAIGGALGAKLLFYIVEIKNVIANPKMLLDVVHGFVVYGGIIGGVICCLLYCKRKKIDALKWFDIIIPEIAIAQGFGRIGCLLAGCCYGLKTDSPFHIVFHESLFAPNNVWLYPTQIMSSVGNFLNFALLVFVIAKIFKKPGVVTSFYLMFYSVGRYIVELFRGDIERGSVGKLSTSQFISIFIFVAGLALFIVCQRKNVIAAPEDAEQIAEPVQEKTEETEASKETEE